MCNKNIKSYYIAPVLNRKNKIVKVRNFPDLPKKTNLSY